MDIMDFLISLGQGSRDEQSAEKIEQVYGVRLKDDIKQVLSKKPEGIFFASDDILRLLSCEEIIDASRNMNVDFVGLKLIPIMDTGDNDYIVYDIEKRSWCKFNIVDNTKFKQRKSLKEFFPK